MEVAEERASTPNPENPGSGEFVDLSLGASGTFLRLTRNHLARQLEKHGLRVVPIEEELLSDAYDEATKSLFEMHEKLDAAIKRAETAETETATERDARNYCEREFRALDARNAELRAENEKLRAELTTVAERQREACARFHWQHRTVIRRTPLVTTAPRKVAPKPEELCAKCGGKTDVLNHGSDRNNPGLCRACAIVRDAPPKSRCTCFWTDAGDGLHKTSFGPLVGDCPEHGVNRPGQGKHMQHEAVVMANEAIRRENAALGEWTDERCDWIRGER